MTVMQRSRRLGRFDVHAEAAVRLSWRGHSGEPAAPMRCSSPAADGVSQFKHWRDNYLLTLMSRDCRRLA
jgi:hypothetical protein